VINDEDSPKSDKILLGIKAVKGHIFIPSVLSNPVYLKGHGQTAIIGVKEMINEKYIKQVYNYDKREKFTFADGG
jgi:hypothetical protein